jgi:hypothetical protein
MKEMETCIDYLIDHAMSKLFLLAHNINNVICGFELGWLSDLSN